MTDQPPLDALAEALGVLDVAQTYGYDLTASYLAALDRIGDLDGDELRQAAAGMAAAVARFTMLESWARGRRGIPDLDQWVRWARCCVARGERP